MLEVVGGVVDVGLKSIGVEGVEVVILEQLDSFLVVVHVHCRYEYFALKVTGEWRTHSNHHSDVVI
jgi:hypothetical protein